MGVARAPFMSVRPSLSSQLEDGLLLRDEQAPVRPIALHVHAQAVFDGRFLADADDLLQGLPDGIRALLRSLTHEHENVVHPDEDV